MFGNGKEDWREYGVEESKEGNDCWNEIQVGDDRKLVHRGSAGGAESSHVS